jgi:Subtilase family
MELDNQDLKEYYITVISFEVIDSFRDDMETPGGSLYIPNRIIECCNYGPISRTLHYMLTVEEAELVAADTRVEGVELNFNAAGIEIMPLTISRQTSSHWDNSSNVSNNMLNWGLVRCTRPRPTLNAPDVYPNAFGPLSLQSFFNTKPAGFTYLPWDTIKMTTRTGASGWSTATTFWDLPNGAGSGKSWGDYGRSGYYNTSITATVDLNATGKNVDVVVIDGGLVSPTHPEFANLDPNGPGGSRCIPYNWYQHNTEIGNGPNGTYNYSGTATSMFGHKLQVDSHALHCTGTVVGNTQGWARESNIYNITFFEPKVVDYVRAFHKNKPINPITKRKNPTVCTNSWGTFGGSVNPANITSVNYRGTNYSPPYTDAQLNDWGIYTNRSVGTRSTSIDASVADAIKEGIIFVAAAGNSSFRNDVAGGPDVDNTVTTTSGGSGFLPQGTWKYNHGLSPGSVVDSTIRICVGALDALPWDAKAAFSNCGPGVDFYAPGVSIMSAYTNSPNVNPAVVDSRSSSHYLQKQQGTSMATPQIAGIAACLMETFPYWTNKELKDYLIKSCENDKIAQTALTYTPGFLWAHHDIKGSPNRIAKFAVQRPTTGISWPKSNLYTRPAVGLVFPRSKFGKK